MICAIHQPQYLPWLGYFDKMARADVFIFLDNVQFKKNEWQNRNRIRMPNPPGWQWLTVPVLHAHGQSIREVRLNPSVDWRRQHAAALSTNYARAPYFKEYWPRLNELYGREWPDLAVLNMACVRLLAECLGVRTPTVAASALGVGSVKTRRLVDLCHAVGADTYVAGAGAEGYMDMDEFRASGLRLEIQQYRHPEYVQLPGSPEGFVAGLSAVDLLMHAGPAAGGIMING